MNHCKEGTCRAGNLTELLRIEVTLTANTTVGNQSLTILASLRIHGSFEAKPRTSESPN